MFPMLGFSGQDPLSDLLSQSHFTSTAHPQEFLLVKGIQQICVDKMLQVSGTVISSLKVWFLLSLKCASTLGLHSEENLHAGQ